MAVQKHAVDAIIDQEEAYARYREALQRDTAPAWRPFVTDDNPSVTIAAEVIALRMGTSDYGRYPIVIYRLLETGEIVSIHAFHTMLRERLAELKTAIGSKQFITYLGQKDSNTRKDSDGKAVRYHHYHAEDMNALAKIAAVDEDFAF